MVKASEILRGPDYDGRLKEVKAWLKSKGIRDLEPVSLYCDVLSKVIVLFALGPSIFISSRHRKPFW
jgi:5'-3' exoribonuclease 1